MGDRLITAPEREFRLIGAGEAKRLAAAAAGPERVAAGAPKRAFRLRAPAPEPAARLPWLVGLSGMLGFLTILLAFRLAVHNYGFTSARWLFWVGLAAIVVPVAARLAGAGTARGERVLLVLFLTAVGYAVKVVYAPVTPAFPDELVHLANTGELLAGGQLYAPDAVLPASAGFPGLSACAAVLSEVSGIGPFAAALVLIGAARLLEAAAVFLVLEGVSGSARLAGIGVVVYAANADWLLSGSQFTPAALALPLLAAALLCAVRHQAAPGPRGRWAWAGIGVVVIAAVALTDPLASAALAVLLWGFALRHVRAGAGRRGPVGLALAATAATGLWLVAAAEATQLRVGSLFPSAADALDRIAPLGFLGLAIVLAPAVAGWVDSPLGRRRLARALVPVAAFGFVASGVAIGWPRDARLPRPLEARVAGGTVPSESLAVADWVSGHIPRALAIVAPDAAGLQMRLDGRPVVLAGTPGARELLEAPEFQERERQLIVDRRISYVVLDRRRSSRDGVVGAAFRRPAAQDGVERFAAPSVRGKFAALPGARVVYAGADVSVYDVSALWRGQAVAR